MRTITLILSSIVLIFSISCKKENSPDIDAESDNYLISYDSLVFSAFQYNDDNQYFSTLDTSFHKPLSKSKLSAEQLKNVDIVYIYDYNYSRHGFMDAHTAGQEWYWNNEYYYFPWLSESKKTVFYTTPLTKNHFDSARNDFRVFNKYFRDTTTAPHAVFPAGSCIGGRMYNPLVKGQVWALVAANGKRRLMLIRYEQDDGWPQFAIYGFHTVVDIISEK